MKKVIALILSLCMIFALCACGTDQQTAQPSQSGTQGNSPTPAESTDDPFADGPEVTLVFATSWTDNLYHVEYTYEVIDRINKESNGKITIQPAFANSLGSDAEMLEGCVAGDIDIVDLPATGMTSYLEELALLEMPMLFENVEEADAVLAEFEQYLQPYYDKLNLNVLCSYVADFRVMTSNLEIETIEDMKGMVIRVPENKYWLQFWSDVGANPTVLSFGDLVVALSQGMADSQENPITALTYFVGCQKYVYNTNTTAYIDHIFINNDVWNELPAAYQELIQKGFDDINNYRMEYREAEALKAIEDCPTVYQMEYVEVSQELLDHMNACKDASYELLREDIGDELVDTVFDLIAKYRSGQ